MRKSTQVAVGGITASLCLLFMFMTGFMPFATYALPAISGGILIAIVIENGYKTATLVYLAVSFLSLFICPDKESVLVFIAFFGYYPIIKGKIEKLRNRALEAVVKFGIFNTALITSYYVVANVLGFAQILAGMDELGVYGLYSYRIA